MSSHSHLTVRRGQGSFVPTSLYTTSERGRYLPVLEILMDEPNVIPIGLQLTLTVERNPSLDTAERLTATEIRKLRASYTEFQAEALNIALNDALMKVALANADA